MFTSKIRRVAVGTHTKETNPGTWSDYSAIPAGFTMGFSFSKACASLIFFNILDVVFVYVCFCISPHFAYRHEKNGARGNCKKGQHLQAAIENRSDIKIYIGLLHHRVIQKIELLVV